MSSCILCSTSSLRQLWWQITGWPAGPVCQDCLAALADSTDFDAGGAVAFGAGGPPRVLQRVEEADD
jgi:hypothetical protein